LTRAGLGARLAVEHSFDLARLGASLHDVLQLDLEEIQITPEGLPLATQPKFADCWLQLPSVKLLLRLEPELAALAVSRVVGKSVRLDNGRELSPGMHGAFAAIAHALGRRLAIHEPPQPEQALATGLSPAFDWHVEFTVRINGAGYRGSLAASATAAVEAPPRPHNPQFSACLPIRLQAIAATCRLSTEELSQLGIGDVLLPGDGWLGTPDGTAAYYLCAPGAETALRVSPNGQALRFSGALQLASGPAIEANNDADAGALEGHVRPATELAFVEVGSLTLPASGWLALKPGDPLPLPQPDPHAAVLRVAGKRLAWGDLVSVEGQPGVRIRGLFDSSL
jgi:hypothetical protein